VSKSVPINIDNELSKLNFLKGRSPDTTDEEAKDAFALLSGYRNGGIFIGHYSGFSEWEKHPNGDEFVQVFDGKTTLILLDNNQEHRHSMTTGEILIVPKNTWHRFESPDGVKVMTITPQPTEHSINHPGKNKKLK
jgi:mannose-6-phosphate isomerase-like protein (cupin superfamily)